MIRHLRGIATLGTQKSPRTDPSMLIWRGMAVVGSGYNTNAVGQNADMSTVKIHLQLPRDPDYCVG